MKYILKVSKRDEIKFISLSLSHFCSFTRIDFNKDTSALFYFKTTFCFSFSPSFVFFSCTSCDNLSLQTSDTHQEKTATICKYKTYM